MNDNIEIRPIQRKDNDIISKIIKSTLEEFNAAIEGTAYTDQETNAMFEAYTDKNAVYFVALLNDEIVAGCGINALKNDHSNICELQKMYMLPKARGKKIGKKLILKCLDFAKKSGYESCYIETFPNMTDAINLYKKNGFHFIDRALGNTCHYSCDVWMLKPL
ncbi:MAG: GNAT family N-acetyltransferase [Flavobacteriaceae bacterium]|nr:GNAT family N-acetyltransferase [Flavobacteriaceae bacterium]